MSLIDTPFAIVRLREPGEMPGPNDTKGDCSLCKQPFLKVAIKHEGGKVFYKCPRCDVVR